MSTYILIDEDDNEFTLDDETYKLLSDSFEVEVDIVERSFRAGADFPGIQRDVSKELVFSYDLYLQNQTTFRTTVNERTKQFRKAVKIKDTDNSIETEIRYSGTAITYDEGAQHHVARIDVTFIQLKPYWEDLTYTQVTDTGTGTINLPIANTGYTDVPSLITVTAIVATTQMSFRVISTNEGMVIKDLQFGSVGLNTYTIDNINGNIELGDTNRNEKIQSGTGFFNFPSGNTTLQVETNGQVTVLVKYKNRYYI
jgi:hypothetical protein